MCVMGLRSWLQVAENEVKELVGETTVILIRSMKPERSFVDCYSLSLISRMLMWEGTWPERKVGIRTFISVFFKEH